jgi:hypothetical protein
MKEEVTFAPGIHPNVGHPNSHVKRYPFVPRPSDVGISVPMKAWQVQVSTCSRTQLNGKLLLSQVDNGTMGTGPPKVKKAGRDLKGGHVSLS